MITASGHDAFQIVYDTIGENNEINIIKKKRFPEKLEFILLKIKKILKRSTTKRL